MIEKKWEDNCSYVMYGKEVAPTTGTPHLQGYLELHKKRGPTGLAKSLPGLERASFRIAKGSARDNYVYSGKDSVPIELGKPFTPGVRNDLVECKKSIDEGLRGKALWDRHFSTMVHNHRALEKYMSLSVPVRKWKTKVMLIIGPPGKQKSTLAKILAPYFGETVWTVPETKGSGLYFDGYVGQQVVILDEMDGTRMKPTMFNGLCDEFEFSVPVHFSSNVPWCPNVLIVISNYHPKYWWKKRNQNQLKQTMRRIDWIVGRFDPIVPVVVPIVPKIVLEESVIDENRVFFPGVVNPSFVVPRGTKVSYVDRLWGKKNPPVPPDEVTKKLFEKSRTASDCLDK